MLANKFLLQTRSSQKGLKMGRRVRDGTRGKKILLVEDEKVLQLLYREELADLGFEVTTANDGFEALRRMEESGYDLVVLDIVMPGMDGLEVLRRIKERNQETPVILHTSHGHYFSDPKSRAADAFIVKSSDLEELMEKVRRLLD
jgi:CheY-like chemotaxis protein